VIFLGFFQRQCVGNTNFTSADFLATLNSSCLTILNKSGCVENRMHISRAKISIPGSTCHCMGVKPGSKPIDDLNFLAIVIRIILVFSPFHK
jgi:hypothetical protein